MHYLPNKPVVYSASNPLPLRISSPPCPEVSGKPISGLVLAPVPYSLPFFARTLALGFSVISFNISSWSGRALFLTQSSPPVTVVAAFQSQLDDTPRLTQIGFTVLFRLGSAYVDNSMTPDGIVYSIDNTLDLSTAVSHRLIYPLQSQDQSDATKIL
jgi:hypothetical protein